MKTDVAEGNKLKTEAMAEIALQFYFF